MINPMEQSNNVVMVTGASSGIGQATCQLLNQLGATIVLVGRNQETLKVTRDTLDEKNHVISLFDFSKINSIEPWFENIIQQTGPLSGIVHCAGEQLLQPLKIVKTEDVERLMNVNVTSGLILAKAFRQRPSHTQNASIVYLASVMGCVGSGGRSTYSATKGAVIAMTKSLALELVRDKIRVNCIAPAFVKTAMFEQTKKMVGDGVMNEVEKLHPLGFGEPIDVANSIAFLLSQASRWITGTTLFVDGGYTAQ